MADEDVVEGEAPDAVAEDLAIADAGVAEEFADVGEREEAHVIPGGPGIAGEMEAAVEEGLGKPVKEWKLGVNLHGEVAVGGGDEGLPTGAADLSEKIDLGLVVADMLEDGIGPADVELAVVEGKDAPGVSHGTNLGIAAAELEGFVDAQGGDLLGVRVILFEVVVDGRVFMVGETDIEDGGGGRRFHQVHEALKLPGAVGAGNGDFERHEVPFAVGKKGAAGCGGWRANRGCKAGAVGPRTEDNTGVAGWGDEESRRKGGSARPCHLFGEGR
jgi:hypothetical protein